MSESSKENLSEVGEFISEYAAYMMGCGVHTSRVVRSAKRIGEAYGYAVKLSVFQKNITLTAFDKDTHEHYNEVEDIPALPISFERNALLSALSWEVYDRHLTLVSLKRKYKNIVSRPFMHPFFVLVMTAFANMSFLPLVRWRLAIHGHCVFRHTYRHVLEAANGGGGNQPLHCFYPLRICRLAMCFHVSYL